MSAEENDFSRAIKEKGIGFIYGVQRKTSESEEELQQRIDLVKQDMEKLNER